MSVSNPIRLASNHHRQPTIDSEACPECDSTTLVKDHTVEAVCDECGLIIGGPKIVYSQPSWIEWEDRRHGPAQGKLWRDAGSTFDGTRSRRYRRLKKQNMRAAYQGNTDRVAKSEIRRMGSSLDVPKTDQKRVAFLFEKISNKGLLKGRAIESVVSACFVIVSREQRSALAFAWVAEVSHSEKREIIKIYRRLVYELEIGVQPPKARQYISRIATRVGVDTTIRRKAEQLLSAAENAGIGNGQSPPGLAAGALYIALREANSAVTQAEISKAAAISVPTLSKQYQRIEDVTES
ncbi:transcription initiation factor IIB [Haloprofundus marisrubri]|uniref:transcription initiation factor IIB n=1 Tax=Haloprofundus marisrubri TaxID=1514971 RepID=UPI0009E24550|nr:transcription initiation factor IIB family protein [Haloprofundus marisrubri]